jgi:cyclase
VLRTRVIPCLLLRNNGLVKTIKFTNPAYVGDPINAVRIFNDKEVDELIFLDISATLEHRPPPFKVISEIASECFMPLGYGGGIRSVSDMKTIFSLGVEKVCVNTAAVDDPDLIASAAEAFGSQSIVVSIDVGRDLFGRHKVFTHSGTRNRKLDPAEFAFLMEKKGAGELFVNSIDRDGTMSGYDLELLKRVTEAVGIPVVACGGAGKIEHFVEAAKQGGVSAVAAGSMFVFSGKHRAVLITYPSREELLQL